ncbi:MAG: xanthine dehydrogenase FAD-binding subunit XdhB [Defluviitaleaceae bacterium]|nr:xanthine dehydrogenase FAD-binding subunit XdhB [Defluviitaleaceae bacterium]
MYDFASYTEAADIHEAVGLLCANPNARIIAGGTDVLIKLRSRDEAFVGRDFVGVTRIPGMTDIRLCDDGTIVIGAAASFAKIEGDAVIAQHLPSLAQAAGSVGGPQIRNMGTVGGNLANGATSADTASMLLACDATLVIAGAQGDTEVPLAGFHQGPGRVKLEHGQILKEIRVAKAGYEGYKGGYIKFAVRRAMDIATLGCAVMIKMDGDRIEDLRIAFGVAGPVPLRAASAEAYAKGQTLCDEVLEQIGRKCLEDTNARDSWRAAKAFRQQLISVLPGRAVRKALGGDGDA